MTSQGPASALDGSPDYVALGQLVFVELRTLARRALRHERRSHTLQPTALAHEAWIRMREQRQIDASDWHAFLALAAQMIRRILVDHARARRRLKRAAQRITLAPDLLLTTSAVDLDIILLHEALEELTRIDERMGRLVELRFFGGLTLEETAGALGISLATAKRNWSFARCWLQKALQTEQDGVS